MHVLLCGCARACVCARACACVYARVCVCPCACARAYAHMRVHACGYKCGRLCALYPSMRVCACVPIFASVHAISVPIGVRAMQVHVIEIDQPKKYKIPSMTSACQLTIIQRSRHYALEWHVVASPAKPVSSFCS